jgi:hypothetical protein
MGGVLSLSVDLFGGLDPSPGFGRLLPGLVVVPELGAFSLGRDVRNAPRTSPSSCGIGAAIPITKAQTQTNPKTITLNRITGISLVIHL